MIHEQYEAEEKLKEECGVFGMYDFDGGDVASAIYYGLFALTRRVLIPLILSVCIGVIVYFVIIIYFYSDHPEELSSIPYANKIIYKFKKH